MFEVASHKLTWADAVAAARRWGEWVEVERVAAWGLAAEARADPSLETALDQRANAFRYERRLLAGDDMVVWLDSWGITTQAWRAHLRRELLRARFGEDNVDPVAFTTHQLETAAWIEAVCSGRLERMAYRLAERMAAWAATTSRTGPPNPDTLVAAERALASRATTESAIEAELLDRRLDWSEVRLRFVKVATRSVANEIVCCVRDDRLDIADVATDAGVPVTTGRMRVIELPATYGPTAIAAQVGEVVGPVVTDDGFLVLVVDSRREPSRASQADLALAEAALVRRALQAEVTRSVRWFEPLQGA